MDGNTGHHLTEDISRVIINTNGLEYIRAHVSERTKNRKTNPRGREVGSLLGPVSVILQDITDALFTGCSAEVARLIWDEKVAGSIPATPIAYT